MAWQMPGQWNPGVPQMTPDMNMGSYTQEQWAAVQQQNWQQWTQWQQQYTQWQTQYGEKYAEQMQSMPGMGGMPPLPPTAAVPPPAPPPPEQPPPPPHENNQPLFGAQPVPPPAQVHSGTPINISIPTGNTNWQAKEVRNEPSQGANSEALKKLAEEERLFDIQFEKWEEEIEKWKQENVNHPDRQAYNEYEQKFETCRAQLLERRHLMKQKRARLLGQAPQAPGSTIPGNTPTAIPPLMQASGNKQNQQPNPQMPNQSIMQNKNQTHHGQNQAHQGQNQTHHGQNQAHHGPNQNLHMQPQNHSMHNRNQYIQNQGQHMPNQSQRNNAPGQSNNKQFQQQNAPSNFKTNNMNQNFNTPSQNYQDDSQYGQYNNHMTSQQTGYNRDERMGVGPQDQYESYEHENSQDYSSSTFTPSNFLPGTDSSKGIPGLDLVPDDKAGASHVIDITEDKPVAAQHPPDYTTISKGINNILGDEKIMNILSIFRDKEAPAVNNQPLQVAQPLLGNNDNYNVPPPIPPPNNQWNRNQDMPNQQFEDLSSNANSNRPDYQKRMNNNRDNNMPPDQYYNRDVPPPNMHPRGPPMRPNLPPPRPLMQGVPGYQEFPNHAQRGPSDNLRPTRPNMPPSRPPLIPNAPGHEGEIFSRAPPGNRPMQNNMAMNQPPPPPAQPPRAAWSEPEPLFTPSIIVEYEHKPLRLKAREFIEPVHMFDYNHTSKEGNNKRKDFEREADELFARKPRRPEIEAEELYARKPRRQEIEAEELYARKPRRPDIEDSFRDNRFAAEDMPRRYSPQQRDFERRYPREELREDHRDMRGPPRDEYFSERRRYEDRAPPREEYDDRWRPEVRGHPREEYDDRRRFDDRFEERFDDRRRDDRDRGRFSRRDDLMNREREREGSGSRDRHREHRREDSRNRSRSRDRDSRKRGRSRESTISESAASKKSKESEKNNKPISAPKHVVMIDDLLEPPGREMRPEKIAIILRGPPGSGKSYLAKLIRDREAEHGGTARIMSIDDYFMQEGEVEEKDPVTGKMVKKPSLKYEYEEKSEETYLNSLKRAFKRTITDGYFSFLIYDAVNDTLRSYADVWNFARQNGFQVYICTMELDSQICFKRNIHGRSLEDVQVVCTRFFSTPDHHIQLDATTLLQSAAITDVHMEDVDDEVVMEDAQEPEVENSFTSKWEKLDDAAQLARLDGTSRPLRASQPSMEDYLQLDDWKPSTAKPGKKTVRWADIEERRQQEKMRAIGFVVGQTDWNRMTDPTMGSSALTQTKYIERVKRN